MQPELILVCNSWANGASVFEVVDVHVGQVHVVAVEPGFVLVVQVHVIAVSPA